MLPGCQLNLFIVCKKIIKNRDRSRRKIELKNQAFPVVNNVEKKTVTRTLQRALCYTFIITVYRKPCVRCTLRF